MMSNTVKKILWKTTHYTLSILIGLITISLLIISLMSTSLGFKAALWALQVPLEKAGVTFDLNNISGTLYHFKLKAIDVKVPRYTINANDLELSWQPWSLIAHAIDIDRLNMKRLTITKNNKQATQDSGQSNAFQINIDHLHVGNIDYKTQGQTYPFGRLDSNISINKRNIAIGRLELNGPILTLSAHSDTNLVTGGQVHAQADWRLHWHHYSGEGHLTLKGTTEHYHTTLSSQLSYDKEILDHLTFTGEGNAHQFTLTHFLLKQNSGGALELKGNIDWSTSLTWHFQAQGKQLDLSNWLPSLNQPISATLTTTKTAAKQSLSAQVDYQSQHLSLQASGLYDEAKDVWHNTLSQLVYKNTEATWQLTQAFPFTQTDDLTHITVPKLCVTSREDNVCARFSLTPQQWHVALHSPHLALAHLIPKTIANTTGYLNIDTEISSSTSTFNPHGHLTINMNQAVFTPPLTGAVLGNDNSIHIKQGQANVSINDKALTGSLLLQTEKLGELSGSVQAQHPYQPKAPLSGQFKLNAQHLAPLSAWIPNLYNLQGLITGTVTLKGTLQQPNMTGELTLAQASATLPSLGIILKNIELKATANTPNHINITSHMQSGSGKLTVDGHIDIPNQGSTTMKLHIQGKSFLAANLPAVTMNVSPNLTYIRTHKIGKLEGSLTIPTALINADHFQQNVQISPDVVLVNAHDVPLTKHTILPTASDIKIQLGNDVNFTGFGLTTRMAGDLSIEAQPNQSALATGKLHSVQGHYSAYGKHFTIEKGTLSFANSPLDNPGLDVTALYQMTPTGGSNHLLSKLEIGIEITGTLRNRTLRLFSDPELSQEDIFSYIVLGQPLDQLQSSEKSALSRAAVLFALKGGSQSLLNTLQNKLGLNQLTLGSLSANGYNGPTGIPSQDLNNNSQGSNQTDDTAVFVGKSLGQNLFISYGIGLFNKQQEVSLSLRLDQHWTLKTTGSSQDSGADIIYHIQSD